MLFRTLLIQRRMDDFVGLFTGYVPVTNIVADKCGENIT